MFHIHDKLHKYIVDIQLVYYQIYTIYSVSKDFAKQRKIVGVSIYSVLYSILTNDWSWQ